MMAAPCVHQSRCNMYDCTFLHPPQRKSLCKRGESCQKDECTKLHPKSRAKPYKSLPPGPKNPHSGPCKHGESCHKYDCNKVHPQGRTKPCKFQPCTKPGCQFLHPSPNRLALAAITQSRAVAPLTRVHFSMEAGGNKQSMQLESVRRQLCFAASVDASGSMAGSRMKHAIEGMQSIVEMMAPDDLFGLVTFSTEVKNLHGPMPRHKVNFAKDAEHMSNNNKNGGSTAVWDSIRAGQLLLQSVKQRREEDPKRQQLPPLVYEQLIITDGEDNSSKISFEEVVRCVANPGLEDYSLVIVAVTTDMGRQEIERLQTICKPAHATLISVDNVGDLKKQLEKQAQRLRLVTEERQGSRTTHTVHEVDYTRAGLRKLTQVNPILQQLTTALGSLGLEGSGPRGILH